MSYVNREITDGLGQRITVTLSAAMREYPSTLISEKYCFAPAWQGFGLEARLQVDAYRFGAYTMSLCSPVWQVSDCNGLVLEIPGLEAELDVRIYPQNLRELLDPVFVTDNTGEYVWRGLDKSNLPETEARYTYASGSGWLGEVNGVPFAAEEVRLMNFSVGHDEVPKYGEASFTSGGDFAASAFLSHAGVPGYSYLAECDQTIGACPVHSWINMTADGGVISLEGDHLVGLANPRLELDITEPPWRYRYKVTDRPGLSLSGARFSDANGKAWTGETSPWFEYNGVSSVAAAGAFSGTGHTETVDPPFGPDGLWRISDPAPRSVGDIECLNTEDINNYTITEYDPDTETERVFKPSRTRIYFPIGGSGEPEGQAAVTADCVTLCGFNSGWQGSGCTVANGQITPAAEDCSIARAFDRAPYPGEQPPFREGGLCPHLPLGKILRLYGTAQPLRLKVYGKERTYEYGPYDTGADYIDFDLTRPLKAGGPDTQPSYYNIAEVDNMETAGEGVYNAEKDGGSYLYGPALFRRIELSGFSEPCRLIRLESRPGGAPEARFYNEFKRPEFSGSAHDGDHSVYRNRAGILFLEGRYAEVPANQYSVTERGAEFWLFHRVSALTGTGGGRLFFPRDDFGGLSVSCPAAEGGTDPPAEDLLKTDAYTAWLADGGKIKPWCDRLRLEKPWLAPVNEFRCFTDLGGGCEGFVNGSADRLRIGENTTNDPEGYIMTPNKCGDGLSYTGQTEIAERSKTFIPGFISRWAIRVYKRHGKIWRNAAGKIWRNARGIILRGDYEED